VSQEHFIVLMHVDINFYPTREVTMDGFNTTSGQSKQRIQHPNKLLISPGQNQCHITFHTHGS